jgi:hypothetical protein
VQPSKSKSPGPEATRLRVVPGAPLETTDDETERRQQQLELARERLRQCKVMVERMVKDLPRDATLGAVLRKTLVERDRRQDECDELVRELARRKKS